MKKKLILFSLCSLLLVNDEANAQTKLPCGTVVPASNERPVVSCPSTSTAYSTRYGRVAGHVPNVNTPVKVVRISFHFFQDNSGNLNFKNNPTDNARIDNIISWMNQKMANLYPPSDPIPGVTSQTHTTIQYEVTGRYFYQNSALNSLSICGGDTPLRTYVEGIDPSRIANSIPIYVTSGSVCGGSASGYAIFPSQTNLTQNSYVVTTFGNAGSGADWAFHGHLLHEMGHNLDLSHTYDGNVYKLDPDYLSDVYDVPWSNYCNPPANNACGHQTGWNVDPFNNSVYATNNLMGGTQNSDYLSPLQLGTINRALALKSVRKYVKPMTSSGNFWIIWSNETWDFDIQTYMNIYVPNGVTLTITCKVYMANTGSISVQPGGTLIVDGGTLSSWGNMWNGIDLQPGSTLIVKNNALIENAETAITSRGGATFTVQDSKLNKNFRGIIMETYGGIHPGVIKNTIISCVDNSNNPVNLSVAPHIGERAYCAVQVQNVVQANIGVTASGQTNTFDNLEMGIVNINSGLTVYNNLFKRINYLNVTNRGRGIESTGNSSERILTVGGTGTYQKNTFQDSYQGVYATINQDVNVVSNTFTNLNTAVNVNNCSSAGNSVYVLSNTINDCNTGVYLFGGGGSNWLEVSSNLINPTGVAKPNSKAITITNPSLSPSATAPTLNVLSNTIKNSSTGIEVTNFTAPNVKSNTLTTSDLGSSQTVHGILVSSCPSTNIESNLVKGPYAAQNAWWLNAIRLESSANSKVIYNGVEDIGRGLFFGGSSAGSQVAKNNMKNNSDGILLNWAIIGYQLGSSGACKAAENTWQGTLPSGGHHIYSYGSDGSQSPMNLLLNTNPAWIADMKTPTTIVSTASAGATAVPVYTCNTLSGYNGPHRKEIQQNSNREQLLELANDKINFPGNDAAGKWWAKYNLYNQLQTETSLQDEESGLRTFAANLKTSTIGKIYELNQLISKGDYAAAKTHLNDMKAANDIERYIKDVYSICIADRVSDHALGNAEVNVLQTIARLCPYESGPAVYAARALLTKVDPTIYFNTCETPDASDRILTDNNTAFTNENEKVVIYPNPANDKLSIAIQLESGQKGQLKIYDVTGKLLISELINGNSAVIYTGSLSEGMYIYRMTVNDAEVKSGKLTIIR